MTTLTFTSPPTPLPLFALATVVVPTDRCTVEEYKEALEMLGSVVTRQDGVLLDER